MQVTFADALCVKFDSSFSARAYPSMSCLPWQLHKPQLRTPEIAITITRLCSLLECARRELRRRARDTDEAAMSSCLLLVAWPQLKSPTTSGLAVPQALCLADGEPASLMKSDVRWKREQFRCTTSFGCTSWLLGARTHVTVWVSCRSKHFLLNQIRRASPSNGVSISLGNLSAALLLLGPATWSTMSFQIRQVGARGACVDFPHISAR